MKELEQLRNILCEVPEIKEDLMELRFGCKVVMIDNGSCDTLTDLQIIGKNYKDNSYNIYCTNYLIGDEYEIITYHDSWIYECCDVIGNPIQLRHLLLYCCVKEIHISINALGDIVFADKGFVMMDLGKDLQDQDPKTLVQIVEFLNK